MPKAHLAGHFVSLQRNASTETFANFKRTKSNENRPKPDEKHNTLSPVLGDKKKFQHYRSQPASQTCLPPIQTYSSGLSLSKAPVFV